MYGYFSNNRFQPNYTSAKCQQDELAVRNAIHKFELSSLKNAKAAGNVLSKTIVPKRQSAAERVNEIKSTFNSWTFIAIFATVHIARLRLLKRNLNEMELPIYHISLCSFLSFIVNSPVSYLLSENYKNKRESKRALRKVSELQTLFYKRHVKHFVVQEATRLGDKFRESQANKN